MVGLFALNLCALVWEHSLGSGRIGFFLLDAESNLPTFISAVFMLEAALVSLPMYLWERQHAGRFARQWLVLSALFVFMALDESARMHEKTIAPIRNAFGLSGALHYSWVVIGLPAAGLLAAFFLPLLGSLERRIALLIFCSGAIFLAGAIGLEMVGGVLQTRVYDTDIAYEVAASFEETLEMLGISIYIYALLLLGHARDIGWCVEARMERSPSD